MPRIFRRLPLTPVVMGLALIAIYACYRESEAGGSRWQSTPVVRFSPDGKQLLIGLYNGRFVSVRGGWYVTDLCATAAVATPGSSEPPAIVDQRTERGRWNGLPEIAVGRFTDWSPSGETLAVGAFQGKVNVWNAKSRDLRSEFESNGRHVQSVAFSPDGKRIASAFRYSIQVRDAESLDSVRDIQPGVNSAAIAFSPDGRYLAVADRAECRIEFWDLADEAAPARVFEEPLKEDESESITSLVYSPDGKTVAVAGERNIRFIDAATRRVSRTINERMVLSLAYSPDGKQLASGRYDGMKLWSAETGAQEGRLFDTPAVESIAFSADGKQLVTGNVDGEVILWNAADRMPVWKTKMTGKELFYLPTMAAAALFAAWLAIGAFLVWRNVIQRRATEMLAPSPTTDGLSTP
ncbi:MAG: WD40 repeat domain-containing protein [Planctomycetaceae bacterium]